MESFSLGVFQQIERAEASLGFYILEWNKRTAAAGGIMVPTKSKNVNCNLVTSLLNTSRFMHCSPDEFQALHHDLHHDLCTKLPALAGPQSVPPTQGVLFYRRPFAFAVPSSGQLQITLQLTDLGLFPPETSIQMRRPLFLLAPFRYIKGM